MPATFGTGVALPGVEGIPADLGRVQISAEGGDTRPAIPAGGVAVLTCVELVTTGGGSGGYALFSILDGAEYSYWSANIGSAIDTFEWRGMIPLGNPMQLQVANVSDNGINVVYSGFWIPTDFRRV